MSSVLDVAKKINKAWKSNALSNIIPDAERLPLQAIGMDYAFYGGIPLRAISVYSGLEHSGKSLGACHAIAAYQRRFPKNVCIYVDAEVTLPGQKEFIQKMTGMSFDENQFLRYDCAGKTAEEIFQDIITLQEAENIGLIVIDSAPALITKADLENDFTKDNGMRASIAKPMGKFLRMMLNYLPQRDNALLIINQVRDGGKTFTGAQIYTESGGYGLKYYPSFKVRFAARKFMKGDEIIQKPEGADGFRISCAITKNRYGNTDRGGGYITYRYETGVDTVGDAIDVALTYGFIHRPTTQSYQLVNLDTGEPFYDTSGNELKFVGKANLKAFLNSNPDFTNSYVEMLTRHMSGTKEGVDLLNEDDLKEILYQEDSVESNLTPEELEEKAELEKGSNKELLNE